MSVDCIADHKLEETGFNYTMSLIQGKYKMFILYTLACYGVVRFNEIDGEDQSRKQHFYCISRPVVQESKCLLSGNQI